MKNILTYLVLAFSIGVVNAQSQDAVSLTIEVEGIEPGVGNLRIALFNSKATYLKEPAHFKLVDLSANDDTQFTIDGLPVGHYAISIIQDENKNGELDMGMMGPTEGFGFSNNARNMFGPADYEEALIEVNQDMTTKIKLK